MIQISELRVPGENPTPFKQFRLVYRRQLFGNPRGKQIDKKLKKSIKDEVFYGMSIDKAQKACLTFLLKYNNVILYGDVKCLERIIEKMNSENYQSLVHDGTQTTVFGEKILTLFNYTDWFRSNQERGIWFAKCFNIKSCPYCNAQYTFYITKRSTQKAKVKFQFDHFYPKERYPYLALSMYNLVPSCYNCNHGKSSIGLTSKTGYHPYENSLSEIAEFHLKYPDEFEKMTLEGIRNLNIETELQIQFQSKTSNSIYENRIDTHDQMFDITEIYNIHKDIAHHILLAAKLNTQSYQQSIQNVKDLFPDRETLLQYILNTPLREEEILSSAFSKFKQDLATQLKVI